MAARSLEVLQKQYNSKKHEAKGGGMPPMGPRRGPGGPGMRPQGKPKNTKQTVKRLLSYLNPYRIRLVFVLVCMLFSTASSLVGGYILRPVINSLVEEGKTVAERLAYLAGILTVIGCVYLCGVIASYCQSRIMLSTITVLILLYYLLRNTHTTQRDAISQTQTPSQCIVSPLESLPQ